MSQPQAYLDFLIWSHLTIHHMIVKQSCSFYVQCSDVNGYWWCTWARQLALCLVRHNGFYSCHAVIILQRGYACYTYNSLIIRIHLPLADCRLLQLYLTARSAPILISVYLLHFWLLPGKKYDYCLILLTELSVAIFPGCLRQRGTSIWLICIAALTMIITLCSFLLYAVDWYDTWDYAEN